MRKIFLFLICIMTAAAAAIAQDSQRTSAQAEAALRAALANEGTITVIDNSSGAILKTLTVNPAETALRTPRGSFHVYITNPARLAIEINNVVHQDLYQQQLPKNIIGNVVVGAQFTGTRFMSDKCGVTILSNRDSTFKIQVSGSGNFFPGDNYFNRIPATVTGIFEATYLGATTGQGMTSAPQTQEQKEQQAMELLRDLLGR